jgi:hypothetical protein
MTTSYRLAATAGGGVEFANAEWNASRVALDTGGVVMQALALPFDEARAQYARGVKAGLIQRSMLAHRDFERWLGATERLLLGPWARRV